MKRFEGILICTDLDGTLLRDDKTVSPENIEAIEYFKAHGGFFTFVTGRMPYFSHMIKEIVRPNAPIGCVNGGGIYDYGREEYLSLKTLPEDVNELVFHVVREVPGIGVIVNTKDRLYFPFDSEASRLHRLHTGMPYLTADLSDFHEPIAKIVFADHRPEAVARVAEALANHPRASEFDFIQSERMLYEILPKGVAKGAVLSPLALHLGVDIKRTVAIGDYNNDIDMLVKAGVGVAVANACPAAKAAADHITVSNEQHAIARVIADIESGAIRFE